ncbi:GTP-binding protein [Candidatus Woesearchaeota archaeon]|nr:GTP-binding protein [Candidatus Woesearchaeota archaeon]
MAAETKLDKFRRLMRAQTQIRNICTSAHIHHGKCISGNSRLILADGRIKTAQEVYEEVSNNGNVFKENEDCTIFSPNKSITVFSLNKNTGRLEKKEIQYAWRLTGGKTIKIKLRNRFEIATTPEHKYIVSKDGNFIELEAKDLKLGDRVVCARKLDANSTMNTKRKILEKLSTENFYVNLKPDFGSSLKKKILEYGIKNLKQLPISVKPKSFYHGLWQNRHNLNDLLKICNLFNLDIEMIYDNISFIFYRTGKQRGQNSLKIKLPVNFEELFYLAGLFLGDGSGKKFVVGKDDLGNKVIEICRKVGIKTTKVQWKEKTPEIITNMTLAYVLKCLFDYPLKKKAHNIKISDFVFNSDKKYIAQLLKGYFDTDGGVEKSRSAVTLSSASQKMIDDLHLLLLRFGCIAIKEKDNALTISGLSAINFEKQIGFGLKEKIEKLKTLVNAVSGSIVCDTVKVGNKLMLVNKLLKDKGDEDLAFIEVKSIEQGFEEVVYDFTVPETHNFVAEGMVIHNTAFTDNLLAAAGLMAEKNAGSLDAGMETWQHKDEQDRLLTVDAANVSMVHEFEGKEYLINLIDTPGHIDFSGNVTRAMRAIDGTIVLVCACEGIMPQTETVIKQALRERVKPLLFINKVDRLIKELQFTPEQMQERFMKIFKDFNVLIDEIAEPELKKKFQVDIMDGSVAFGSARDNWAMSVPFMKKKNIGFKDILKIYELSGEERKKWVWENAPLHEVVLDMVIKHLPDPLEAQKYRIPKIWHGDPESEFGKDIISCNPNGKVAQMEEVTAGNVLAIAGVVGNAGETITAEPEQAFTELKHIFEPVITKAIEAAKPMDLPKLVEVLRKVAKEDPSIKIEINEETGEHLMSGMGELHLEIIEGRIKTEKGVDVKTSPPIVVYRESITKQSPEIEGKTPNKHNKFMFVVEPLNDEIYKAAVDGILPEMRIRKKDEELWKNLEIRGMDSKTSRRVKDIYKDNMLIEITRGEVHLPEVMELIIDAFEEVMRAGPLCREPCNKIKVTLTDVKLHEDAIHRGPAQVYPAVREGIRGAMMYAKPVLLEPLQVLLIEGPAEYMGEISKLVSRKRGQLFEMNQEGMGFVAKAKMPVAELLGWASDLRSATSGRGVSSLIDQMFEPVPAELQAIIIKKIIERKGLTEGQLGA